MSFVADLEMLLGVTLITDPDITATYSKDQAPFAQSTPAAAVLLARSTEEISKALAFCSERKIPVVTRGKGYGLAFLKELGKICVERDYERLQWWVLDWNQPSIDFYKSLGAVAMDEWTVYRVSGEALKKLGS